MDKDVVLTGEAEAEYGKELRSFNESQRDIFPLDENNMPKAIFQLEQAELYGEILLLRYQLARYEAYVSSRGEKADFERYAKQTEGLPTSKYREIAEKLEEYRAKGLLE